MDKNNKPLQYLLDLFEILTIIVLGIILTYLFNHFYYITNCISDIVNYFLLGNYSSDPIISLLNIWQHFTTSWFGMLIEAIGIVIMIGAYWLIRKRRDDKLVQDTIRTTVEVIMSGIHEDNRKIVTMQDEILAELKKMNKRTKVNRTNKDEL